MSYAFIKKNVEKQAPCVQPGDDLFEWEGATRTLLAALWEVSGQVSCIVCFSVPFLNWSTHSGFVLSLWEEDYWGRFNAALKGVSQTWLCLSWVSLPWWGRQYMVKIKYILTLFDLIMLEILFSLSLWLSFLLTSFPGWRGDLWKQFLTEKWHFINISPFKNICNSKANKMKKHFASNIIFIFPWFYILLLDLEFWVQREEFRRLQQEK